MSHVAICCYAEDTAAVCPSLPSRHSFRVHSWGRNSISEDRSKKHPLIRQQRVFTVWHRLSQNSPASDYSPFMVELFTAARFAGGPRLNQNRFRLSPAESSPRRPTLNAPECQGRTPWTGLFILTRLGNGASKHVRRPTQPCQYKDTRFDLRRPDEILIEFIRLVRVAPLPAVRSNHLIRPRRRTSSITFVAALPPSRTFRHATSGSRTTSPSASSNRVKGHALAAGNGIEDPIGSNVGIRLLNDW